MESEGGRPYSVRSMQKKDTDVNKLKFGTRIDILSGRPHFLQVQYDVCFWWWLETIQLNNL
jgi:hypothetical protein